MREISILEAMKGGVNCIDLIAACDIEKSKVTSLVSNFRNILLKLG